MVAFTITDKKDGTGIDVSITGTDAETWELFVAQVPGGWRDYEFQSRATDDSEDDIEVDLGVGAYVAVLTVAGIPYGPKPFRVTDGSQGTHYRCLAGIREEMLALTLPMVSNDPARHKLRKVPAYAIKDFGKDPQGVHYWMLPERPTLVDNANERTIFPVQVAFLQGNERSNDPNPDWTHAREMIRMHFTGKALPGVSEIDVVMVQPARLYGLDSFELSLDYFSLIFECQTDQTFRLVST